MSICKDEWGLFDGEWLPACMSGGRRNLMVLDLLPRCKYPGVTLRLLHSWAGKYFYVVLFFKRITTSLPILAAHEEKLLLHEVANGNEKAFRTLYDAYFNHLSAYIFKLCKSDTATEEIVQDIFVKLWISRTSIKHVDSPEAYIFSMARNKTIDYLRRLAKESNLMDVLEQQLAISNNNVEDKLNAEELKHLIEEALDQLSDQKRKIFQLSKNEGLSHDEIAEKLHLSKSTVKNHLSETLQHVRQHLRRQPNSEALLLLLATMALQ